MGVRILYGLMNELPGVWCERVFAPWGDMEEEMRREGLPLYGLESGDPVSDFDILGFSLGYEMAYSNVLNLLDLAGLPLRSADRDESHPLVIAGGTCAYNPEPLAPFIDLFSLGEGEEVTVELIQLYRKARRDGWSRRDLLLAAARIPCLLYTSPTVLICTNPSFIDVKLQHKKRPCLKAVLYYIPNLSLIHI